MRSSSKNIDKHKILKIIEISTLPFLSISSLFKLCSKIRNTIKFTWIIFKEFISNFFEKEIKEISFLMWKYLNCCMSMNILTSKYLSSLTNLDCYFKLQIIYPMKYCWKLINITRCRQGTISFTFEN